MASTCAGPNRGPTTSYNTPLHVAALFIILLVSTLACAFPLLTLALNNRKAARSSSTTTTATARPPNRRRRLTSFLFCARHFGTGVLLATAFVHLLPTAFTSLGDPCLSNFWTEDYQAMPGAICLLAIFFIATVEMVFSPGGHMHGHKEEGGQVLGGGLERMGSRGSSVVGDGEEEVEEEVRGQRGSAEGAGGEGLHLRHLGPWNGRSNSVGRRLTDMGERRDQDAATETRRMAEEEMRESQHEPLKGVVPLTPEQEHKKALLQCMLLEMGILFHSIFIGMALSVSIGKEFIILLIAIAFHQTFEGLALGSRIAALKWKPNAIQPWMMSLAYGCTTPVGQAIGLGLHTLYSPDSEVGLLVVGIMNAISAGLLVYASLVELMAEDFLSDESWRVLRGKRRVYACLLVFLGAIGMSLVGAWA
ncbi:Zinc/iron permease [Lasiodiplodia theobromae]|uniref:Zinc/iron permease n=1 Tax=Lasiodiplodia theobromae TaxID=45133 RepID=UPI0015C38C92|nr:Zinc/iron permease [Lasiodiplodia theobromae]KAF4546029.1 Zinc/iron permease [Lasiodiplodia theobromae]